MTINIRSTQPTAPLKGKLAAAAEAAGAAAPAQGANAAPAPQQAPTADGALAGLGTGLASLDKVLEGAVSAIAAPHKGFFDSIKSAIASVSRAVKASTLDKPLQPDPRVVKAVQNGVTRGEQFAKSIAEVPKEKVGGILGWFKGVVNDVAKGIGQVVDEVKKVPMAIFQAVTDELGLGALHPTVTRDPSSPMESDQAATDAATKKLADPARALQAKAAIAKLPPDQQKAYQALFASMAVNPRSQAALQDLAISGKLAGKDLKGGQTLMQNLQAIATQPLADGIDRSKLLNEVVQELADPVCIQQEARNTCGATTAQILLANRNPAEYARIVAGLSSPAGKTTLQDGSELHRDPNWNVEDGGRTTSSRLIQPAFMTAAGLTEYDNVKDGNKVPGTSWAIPGMMPWGMEKLLTRMTGQEYDSHFMTLDPAFKKATPDHPVPICVNYSLDRGEVAPHWLQVTGYDPATKTATIINPWGRTETISEDELRKHMIAEVYER